MRCQSILCIILTAAVTVTPSTTHARSNQRPLINDNLGLAMPPPREPTSSDRHNGDAVILSDVLGRDRSINIFAGFTRDIAAISERFADRAQNSTILAPINSAITALPRKPWEDPKQYDTLGMEAYEGPDGEERARKNMLKFVEAHIVPVSPWEEGEKVKTLGGDEVWWESQDGEKTVQPGNIEVSSIPGKVYNGEVWILKSVRGYA